MFKKLILLSGLILSSNVFAQAPSLPMGFGGTSSIEKNNDVDLFDNFVFDNFIEVRYGERIKDQNYQDDKSISEIRLHSEVEYEGDNLTAKLSADFTFDEIMEYTEQDFQTGDGYIDLREANFSFSPFDFMDVKFGRQIITWGVGDLVFINDFFPKDWNAFFFFFYEEYLKAPSDALQTSLYSSAFNMDIVYMPNHDASRYIDGRRISFFSPTLQRPSGFEDPIIEALEEKGDEMAVKLYKNIGSAEISLYYFDGYWKTPEGSDGVDYIFPELEVVGASLRAPLASGILSLETGYYDSSEDIDGSNALIKNSETRYLIGFEKELFSNFTANLQYYVEEMNEYKNYLSTLPGGMVAKDEKRELWTLRLTQMLMKQKLILSMFNYYSPTDKDGYVRVKATYKPTNNLMFELGGNIFFGEKSDLNPAEDEQTTFFGQFEDNSNIFGAIRYSF